MRCWSSLVVVATLAMGLAQPARADCSQCTCAIDASGLNFGAYNPLRPAAGSVGVIRVSCTNDNGYTIRMSAGSSGTTANRVMHNGAHSLTYNLYKDPGRVDIWGDGSGSTGVTGAGTMNYNVYGSIAAGQTPVVGSYVDTLIVMIDY